MNKEIKTVAVCGAGTMGSGIAQVCSTAGYTTILYELNEEVLNAAKTNIAKSLVQLESKGKINAADRAAIEGRIRFTNSIEECTADLVIEAIVELPEIKVSLFNHLAAINNQETIFASNTSSLSINALAQEIKHPERVAGLHFFNPAPIMKLVEVVKAEKTAEEVLSMLIAFTTSLGKTPVVCRDAPGFIVNRVARPYYIEALRLAEEGYDLSTIDHLLEDRGFKLGPFKLMDLIGNDVNYAVSCSVHQQLGEPERLKPSYLQKAKVDGGQLGKKTGTGYYSYQQNEPNKAP